ncbi:MAG: hypothetical protein IPH31_24155 [Lewinellaceae bacterium]|nr:hypothetical protein [Lewinellaceae bacterium]
MSGYDFQLGTSTVTHTTTRNCQRQTWSCSFMVTVEDNEAPVIECPGDMVTVQRPRRVWRSGEFDNPTATDNCELI